MYADRKREFPGVDIQQRVHPESDEVVDPRRQIRISVRKREQQGR